MQLKPMLAAAVTASFAFAAQAEDFTDNVNLVPNPSVAGNFSAGWGVTHLLAGAFTDTFSFSGTGLGSVNNFNGSLISIGFVDTHEIDFSSVSINGQSFVLSEMGGVSLASFGPEMLNGPLSMQVSGSAGPGLAAGSSITASYAGTANVTAVPEPGSMAMLAAGLGVVGLLGRRRSHG